MCFPLGMSLCRDAFSGFDAEAVAKYNEKKITSISTEYNIELSLIRGAVDNASRILEVHIQKSLHYFHHFTLSLSFFQEQVEYFP